MPLSSWTMTENPPPLLVVGKQGSGKTQFIRGLLKANPYLMHCDMNYPNSRFRAKRGAFKNGIIYESESVPKEYQGAVLRLSLEEKC